MCEQICLLLPCLNFRTYFCQFVQDKTLTVQNQ
uniref:Uncharacterized protein n=1 Tax=Anguilla anguilla TaxID=7936 RepID=A0A0E9TVI4_ANGAN